jgi:hypothetical protein
MDSYRNLGKIPLPSVRHNTRRAPRVKPEIAVNLIAIKPSGLF